MPTPHCNFPIVQWLDSEKSKKITEKSKNRKSQIFWKSELLPKIQFVLIFLLLIFSGRFDTSLGSRDIVMGVFCDGRCRTRTEWNRVVGFEWTASLIGHTCFVVVFLTHTCDLYFIQTSADVNPKQLTHSCAGGSKCLKLVINIS